MKHRRRTSEGAVTRGGRDWDKDRTRRLVSDRIRQDPEYGKTGPAPYVAWKDLPSCGKCRKPIEKGTTCFTWNGRAAHAVCPDD